MSIASEIKRLTSAKQDIKGAIEKRGVSVDDTLKLGSFANMITSAPYAVRGTFTPEEDTQLFSVSGLPFVPCVVFIVSNELYETAVTDSFIMIAHSKASVGLCLGRIESGASQYTSLVQNSKVSSYTEDSYTFDSSLSSGSIKTKLFKSGYTYEYFIAGGFPE